MKIGPPPPRGYSIVELLVAMAITSFMILVLMSLVGQSTSLYDRTQRAVNSLSQARAFLQFFHRELGTRVAETPLVHQTTSPGLPLPAHRLAFVHTVSLDEQLGAAPGDLGTSVYYIAFSPDRPDAVSPKLFRRLLGPAETQEFIDAGATPPFPTTDPGLDEAIVENVLSFQLQLQALDPTTGQWREWDPAAGQPPAMLHLSLRFLDHAGAERFRSQGEWARLATAPTASELPLIREFSRSIPLSR